jgi:phosphoribosylformimino-5-aminoimidazole carboxamide ribonucleotide (ProFAR) isomerase
LEQTFNDLNIDVASQSLNNFINTAIQVSGAVDKIDFDNFNTQLNETHKLLEKVNNSGRSYSEEDYKALIAANKSLESKFIQIGDKFMYVNGTMQELREAIE